MSEFDGLLITTFESYRKARASDGAGGWSEAYASIGTVLGRLRPLTATERISADKAEARVTHVLYCRTTADVARGDIETSGDMTVEVIAVREPSLMAHHYEVDCRQTQPEETTWLGS